MQASPQCPSEQVSHSSRTSTTTSVITTNERPLSRHRSWNDALGTKRTSTFGNGALTGSWLNDRFKEQSRLWGGANGSLSGFCLSHSLHKLSEPLGCFERRREIVVLRDVAIVMVEKPGRE